MSVATRSHVDADDLATLPCTTPRGAVLRAVIHSEFTKLRTVRSTWWTLVLTFVAIVGLGALLTGLEVSRWDQRSTAEVIGFDPLLYAFAALPLAQLSLGVLGVLAMTSEYATGTARLTFGATPQRGLVLAAKAVCFATVVAVVGTISCVIVFFIAQMQLRPVNADVSLTDPGVLRAVAGGVGHLVLIAIIAVGVGAAVRRTAAAVALLFGVLLVLPGLVYLLPAPWNDDVTKYLPSSAGVAMSAVVRFPNLLSPLGGFVALLAYTAAVLTAAMLLLVRRDA